MGKRKVLSKDMLCRICGDTARGVNFNVITCMSCKTFFRRNAYRRQYMSTCQFNKNCCITNKTRSYCSACRLEKCFVHGMDPLMIRSIPTYPSNNKKSPKQQINQERSLQLSVPYTLDLLQNDRSTLTTQQWNLISNIIHAYDEQRCTEQIKLVIHQMNSLLPKLRSKSYSYISDIIIQGVCNIQALIHRSSDFYTLSMDNRRSLIKHNMYITSVLNGLFLFRELDLFNHPAIYNAFNSLYGHDVTMACMRNSDRCDINGNLIKISLFIMVFSTNCSITTYNNEEDTSRNMSNTMDRNAIQNMYVTVFWKYLVYLYGFQGAVHRFSSLVKQVLNLLHIAELIMNNGTHNQKVDRVINETERSLIIED